MRLSASKAALKFFSGPESFPASQASTANFRMPMAVAAVTRQAVSISGKLLRSAKAFASARSTCSYFVHTALA